jgi:hypothetical protein
MRGAVALEEQWQRAAMAREEQTHKRSRGTRAAMTREQSGSSLKICSWERWGNFSCGVASRASRTCAPWRRD